MADGTDMTGRIAVFALMFVPLSEFPCTMVHQAEQTEYKRVITEPGSHFI